MLDKIGVDDLGGGKSSKKFKDEYIDNVPTLGIVALNLPIVHWKQLKMGVNQLKFFIYPKMFKK